MTQPIVLFGGTFDPVHNGHLIVARSIAEQLGIDSITLMPAAKPPHKPAAAAGGEHRIEMLRLATADDPLFEICDLELTRPGPSYTLDTVRALRDQLGQDLEVRLIIGADMLAELPNWHQVSQLLCSVEFIVAARPPLDQQMEQIWADIQISLGRDASQRLSESVVKTPLLDISSTDIRNRVSQGLSISYLVPESVRAYISVNGLYKT